MGKLVKMVNPKAVGTQVCFSSGKTVQVGNDGIAQIEEEDFNRDFLSLQRQGFVLVQE